MFVHMTCLSVLCLLFGGGVYNERYFSNESELTCHGRRGDDVMVYKLTKVGEEYRVDRAGGGGSGEDSVTDHPGAGEGVPVVTAQGPWQIDN